MTRQTVAAYAEERLREIQDNASRWGLPDATWAETLVQTPDGHWVQAFALRSGQARPLTDVVWVPLPRN